jgi:tRNA-binding protein
MEAADPAGEAPLTWDEFRRMELRVGTILAARLNEKARVPAFVLEIDLGELGSRASSAQLTDNYTAEQLPGRQVVCVVNFAPRRVAGVKSEVLVLGALDDAVGTILLDLERPVTPGTRIA